QDRTQCACPSFEPEQCACAPASWQSRQEVTSWSAASTRATPTRSRLRQHESAGRGRWSPLREAQARRPVYRLWSTVVSNPVLGLRSAAGQSFGLELFESEL